MASSEIRGVFTLEQGLEIDDFQVEAPQPDPKGYNALAICEAGYCYDFLFSSPVRGVF